MRRLLLTLLAACFWATPLLAQSFQMTTGRNHPELRWRVAETAHFEIVYPQRLAGIEAEAAPIAEASYNALTADLGVKPQGKLKIYLSDQDEIANGFALPLGAGYTQIWVHVNDFARTWTGREKWLRKVIAHELTHLFHYRAVRSDLGLVGLLGGNALPSFWAEGLAQYETETWDAQRGDRWLRTAVLADRLSYEDGRSIRNGRLRYAVGNSQVRYLAATRGDSTIRKILAHRSPLLFGLERHDFYDALEDVTGESYRDFYDDWRRHVNVYYNALAGQLPSADSLVADSAAAPLGGVPGQYLYDLQPAPNDPSRIAVLSVLSPTRPLRRLYVLNRDTGEAEPVAGGPIKAPVSWSRDGKRLAFARTTRGDHGSLLNDLFVVNADGGGSDDGERRLTDSRRAAAPAFRPGHPDELAFVGVEGPTANVFLLNLETGRERRLTDFSGDVQISALAWHPGGPGGSDTLAFARFTDAGVRDLALLDVPSGEVASITASGEDSRVPVFSPSGDRLAYTSLRDDVPNVFTYDLATGARRRVTNLVEGATAYGWLPPADSSTSAHARGQLAAVTAEGKARDRALLVDAAHTAAPGGDGAGHSASAPPGFARWTTVRPPREVPTTVAPNASLIEERHPYSSLKNFDHVISAGLPYYAGARGYGIAAGTVWFEPLAKHLFYGGGGLAVDDLGESFFYGEYVNNQLAPELSLTASRIPREPKGYGRSGGSFEETTLSFEFEADWPLDWSAPPFTRTRLETELQVAGFGLTDTTGLDLEGTGLAPPEAGQEVRLELALEHKRLTPYAYNLVHPLGGHGWRVEVTGAAPLLGADSRFLRGDAAAFRVLPGLFGRQRLYLFGRAQAQTGDAFPQDFLGFSRSDAQQFQAPPFFYLNLARNERVRGYRSYAAGNRVLFGTAEYRVPLAPSLQTEVLGFARLGATTAALFADGGLVWNGADFDGGEQRLGLGVELKNEVVFLGGGLRLGHALGVAQPADRLGTFDDDGDVGLYYRVRAAVPF